MSIFHILICIVRIYASLSVVYVFIEINNLGGVFDLIWHLICEFAHEEIR